MRCYVKQMNNHTKHQISRLPADSKAFRNLAELCLLQLVKKHSGHYLRRVVNYELERTDEDRSA
jgi:hypothetical protein